MHDDNDYDSDHEDYDEYYDEEFTKSKTRVKKEMHALQELGEELTHLTPAQLDTFPLGDALKDAILEAPKITSNSASKRHRQFIGKLMRAAEHEEIAERLQEIKDAQHRLAQQHHVIERWRDELVKGDDKIVHAFIADYPHCDRQQFRQLVRNARGEQGNNKPPAHTRKLFKFLRDTVAAHSDDTY